MKRATCFIVGCRNLADLILWTYPDPVILCRDHRHLGTEDETIGGMESVLLDMEGAP